MKKKKVIILDHNHGRFGNQLWNYISVFAYCLERNFLLENPSFGNYRSFFSFSSSMPLTDFFLFNRFKNSKFYSLTRPYHRYVLFMKWIRKNNILNSGGINDKIVHLPPSPENIEISKKLFDLENNQNSTLYFCGGRFRNPTGIEKYRKEICRYFKPNSTIENSTERKNNQWRKEYKHIVGVHIRQGDFKTDGAGHFVSCDRFVPLLKKYMETSGYQVKEVLFILCSDEKIEEKLFADFNIIIHKGNLVEDLFILSSTNVIIGSNSTFGAFAAYYGNIPFIVVDNIPLDWDYYREKNTYFENKYCTVVKY